MLISNDWKGSPDVAHPSQPQNILADLKSVHFQDESREIASEYAGGVKRYAPFLNISIPARTRNSPPTPRNNPSQSSMGTIKTGRSTSKNPTLPPILPLLPDVKLEEPKTRQLKTALGYYPYSPVPLLNNSRPTSHSSDHTLSPAPVPKEVRRDLGNAEETLYMQVFVEEVGIWMDSLDPLKHVRPPPSPPAATK